MLRRWRIDVWVLAAVFVVLAGLDATVKLSAAMTPVRLTSAWKLRADVLPGQALDASMVDEVDVKAGEQVLTTIPDGEIFVHGMHAGDLIRQDDVTRASTVTTVPLDFKVAPDLVPGDYIDVYGVSPVSSSASTASSPTASSPLQLLGRHLPVVAIGSHVVVDVPSGTAADWAYVVTGQQQLVAFISSGGSGCARPGPLTLGDAMQELHAAATEGGDPSTAPGCTNG